MRTSLLLLVFLASLAAAGDTQDRLVLARRTMEAHVRAGDALRAKGDLDGALKAYRAAIDVYEAAMALAEKPKPAPPSPKTAEQRTTLVAAFIAVLNEADASMERRYDATVQLGGLRDPAAIPALVRVLQTDKHELVRRAGAWSLGQFGKQAAPAVPALIAAVGTGAPYVAYMATRALRSIAKDGTGKDVSMGFEATMAAADRATVQVKWAAWWEANRAAFK